MALRVCFFLVALSGLEMTKTALRAGVVFERGNNLLAETWHSKSIAQRTIMAISGPYFAGYSFYIGIGLRLGK
jgi:hypothetical protein